MKKRKELNALIGLGPGDGRGRSRRSRRAWKGASGHRLLRTEPPASGSASSSEDEDDDDDDEDERGGGGGGGGGTRARFARGDYFRCCKVCYPLCAFVILAACVVACVGLVWMQVALKEDLDALKDQFRILESNQKSSFQEIPKLNEDLLRKQKQLEKIESGDLGLSKVWINITEMAKQIALLTSTVNHLKANVKSASDLISLPATVEGLQKSVASIGSTLNSVRLAVEAIQKTVDEHKKTIETLQSNMFQHPEKESSEATPSPSMVPGLRRKSPRENFQQDMLHLQSSLEEVNRTLVGYQRQNDLKLLGMDGTVRNLSQRVTSIGSSLVALNKLGKRENLSFTTMADGATSLRDSPRTDGEQAQILKKEDSADSQASKLREKLQLITALTGKPEPNKPPKEASEEEKRQSAASKLSAFPKFSPRSLGNQVETIRLRPVSIPEISSLTDLLDLFQKTGQGPEGKLSYQDLWDLLGSAVPSAQSMAEFDTDRDGRYSFPELRLALGIEHMEQN
ncbi:EF-hand calcium-binding domain-containing protein 14 isoform X1 [Trichosurus vulpecula]|uniref:EF-hand calcium-binding domain-containing protein 14 isoform X1 n=1 Tax=Trichosurus vulpecula TaxID=9337 RepID=UPI00186B4B21|nr:EF-hand calcium-binding domain-containing protein 14 isoform X1 [Trichosurus vulpecula]